MTLGTPLHSRVKSYSQTMVAQSPYHSQLLHSKPIHIAYKFLSSDIHTAFEHEYIELKQTWDTLKLQPRKRKSCYCNIETIDGILSDEEYAGTQIIEQDEQEWRSDKKIKNSL
jgi:hypothetical protein